MRLFSVHPHRTRKRKTLVREKEIHIYLSISLYISWKMRDTHSELQAFVLDILLVFLNNLTKIPTNQRTKERETI